MLPTQPKPKRRTMLKRTSQRYGGGDATPHATPQAVPKARQKGPFQPPHASPGAFWQKRLRVVLVETGDSLNIGSAARAMSNLGFDDLHLVAPPRFNAQQAARSACWAAGLISVAPQHENLSQALEGVDMVAGFTSRHGRNRTSHLMLADWLQLLIKSPPNKVAFLFGSEDHGLLQCHLDVCHYLVRIPSAEENPSFNLAQAVLLALFSLCEMTRNSPLDTNAVGVPDVPSPARASMADYDQLDLLVLQALQHSQFIHKGTPSPVPGIIRRMLRRLEPNTREMGLLLGMFGKITRALAGRVPCVPLQPKEGTQKSTGGS